MKTKQLFAAVAVMAAMGMNGQNVASTSSITSGGFEAGTTGTGNTFYGYRAGKFNSSTALNNTFIGSMAGQSNTDGDRNIFLGYSSGSNNTTGSGNIFIGNYAGDESYSGNSNVIIGGGAGSYGNGSRNIFIGNGAGEQELGDDKLYISNSETETPLIWGDFANDLVKLNAKVGVGGVTSFPTHAGTVNVDKYKLIVKGGVLTEEVRVSLANTWADYVFNEDYKLAPLADVECFIEENGHLPNVPSAAQVKEEGIELGDMARIQQEKIEELTLYLIEQNKKLEEQEKEIEELKAAVQSLLEKK